MTAAAPRAARHSLPGAAAVVAGVAGLAAGAPAFAEEVPDVPQAVQPSVQVQVLQLLRGASTKAPPLVDEYPLPQGREWRYSDFLKAVRRNQIDKVQFARDQVRALCLLCLCPDVRGFAPGGAQRALCPRCAKSRLVWTRSPPWPSRPQQALCSNAQDCSD